MFFLNRLYEYTEAVFGDTINHFPLVKLIFYSLDKTLVYFLIWFLLRAFYLIVTKKKTSFFLGRELLLNGFVFYFILLFQLTVFRGEYTIMNVYIEWRPISEVNWEPFTETFKLTNGTSQFDFFYNLYGNIFWFIPMGCCLGFLLKKRHPFFKVVMIGFLCSLSIETMQFLFRTGVADIDDLIFNTIGTILGYMFYEFIFLLKKTVSKTATSH